MAKYAKRKKKGRTSRRRRIGAVALNASSPLVQYGSIAAGYLLGDKINAPIDSMVGTTVDTKIIAAGQLGIGYMLALRKGGKKNLITTIAGGVMLGAGAKRMMTSLGIGKLSGYQMVPAIGGYGDVPSVGYASKKRIGAYVPGGSRSLNGYSTTHNPIGAMGSTGLSGR